MIQLHSCKNQSTFITNIFTILCLAIFLVGCEVPNILPDPTLEVTVPSDQMVDFGEEVTLNGFANHSSGATTSFMWEITSKPSNSNLSLSSPNQANITFTPDQIGEYILKFTATSDDNLSSSDEVIITVIKAPVRLSGTINEDITLENVYDDPADPDYLVESSVIFGADVTIEEGVLIVFEQNAGMQVNSNGSISALGSEQAPIVFTGTNQSPGFWKGLNIESRNNNKFDFVRIEYGGSGGFDGANRRANLTLNNAILEMSNSTLSNGQGIGLLTRNPLDELPNFTNNILTENAIPCELNKMQFHFLNASNDFKGNTDDYINSWGQTPLSIDVTWQALNVPYRFSSHFEIIDSDLVIEKGSEFIGQDNTGFVVGIDGTIEAVGSESEPILFRGEDDIRGFWTGIEINSNSTKNIFDNVIVKNGGARGFSAASPANLLIRDIGRLELKNSELLKSGDYGLVIEDLRGLIPVFEKNIITNNARSIECKIQHFHYFDTESDLTGNDEDVIETTWSDKLSDEDVTWKNTGVPFKITKAEVIASTISINPGVELIFTDDSGLAVTEEGSFIAEGSSEEPIIMRGEEGVQGYWRGIRIFSKKTANKMAFVNISDGGSRDFDGLERVSNIELGKDAILEVTDCFISNSDGYGIRVQKDGILTERDNTFENNKKGDIFFDD